MTRAVRYLGLPLVTFLAAGLVPQIQPDLPIVDEAPLGLLADEASDDAADEEGGSEAAGEAPEQPQIRVRGGGWGHSVGMSQYGARTQALDGRSYARILAHYYRGVDVGHARGLDPATEIRVHLFRRRDVDASRVELQADSRNGGPSTTDIRLRLGEGSEAEEVILAHGEVATITVDADGPLPVHADPDFLVSLPSGEERRVDANAIEVAIDEPAGDNPALLRLPQHSVPEGERDTQAKRLAGTYQWGDVRIHHAGDDQLAPVLELPMHRYLRGLSEMPNSWGMEALKAQVLAARTFATRPAVVAPDAVWHVDTTPATQAYGGWAQEASAEGDRWVAAVESTRSQVVTFVNGSGQRDYAQTFYSSSHARRSENSEDSWAYSTPFPYLRSVADPWSVDPRSGNPYAAWEKTVGNASFAEAAGDQVDVVAGVSVRSRTDGGSPETIEIRGFDENGKAVTTTFSGADAQTNAGAALRNPLQLRSQQITGFGLVPFVDDDGHPLEYNIWAIADRGVTKGCDPADESRFCPQETVTRGEMASFLARARNLEAAGPPPFPDVEDDHVHADGIAAVAEAGIAQGFSDGTYRPGAAVTRAQMATFLAEAFDLGSAGSSSGFDDIGDSAHADAIESVAAAGITNGCAEGSYCPRRPVTRAQMAGFLARALGTGW